MTLVEVCEPIFQYVCRVNRSARKGVSPDMAQCRADVKHILTDIRAKAAAAGGNLAQLFDKVEAVLLGFVDGMFKSSKLSWAGQWQDLAHEKREMMMDEKFFDLLDETLRDTSEAGTERLAVFYTCMGLGFTGWYAGQPEELRRKMKDMASRLRDRMDSDMSARICPESYEHTDKRVLYEAPTNTMTRIGLVVAVLAITVLAVNIALFHTKRGQMQDKLSLITSAEKNPGTSSDSAGGAK